MTHGLVLVSELEDQTAQVGQEPAMVHTVPIEGLDSSLVQVIVASMEVTVGQAPGSLTLGETSRKLDLFALPRVDLVVLRHLGCELWMLNLKFPGGLMELRQPFTLGNDSLLVFQVRISIDRSTWNTAGDAYLKLVSGHDTRLHIGRKWHFFANVINELHKIRLFCVHVVFSRGVDFPRLDDQFLGVICLECGHVDDVVVALDQFEV